MIFITTSIILSMIFILLCVAFFTLLERKGLAYRQRRKGPDKIFLSGLLQPLMDGLKLILKSPIVPHQVSYLYLFLPPAFFFFLMLQMWISFSGWYCVVGGFWGFFLFVFLELQQLLF